MIEPTRRHLLNVETSVTVPPSSTTALSQKPKAKFGSFVRKAKVVNAMPVVRRASTTPLPTPRSGVNTAPEMSEHQQKVLGAKKIQQAYRRLKFMYVSFGPMLFCRKEGAPADYGKIAFVGATHGESSFVTVSDSTSIDLFTNFMAFCWKLWRPEVVISITGGARDFDLTPRLLRVFDRGLVDAARASKAWLITGGTDTGVMKIVADAMASHGVNLPVIGIAPLGCVNRHSLLSGCKGGTVRYPGSTATGSGAPLNKHHNHFVLVDNGVYSPAPWGSEIVFRSRLIAVYREQKRVPSVLLVVQGGPGTLKTIVDDAKVNTPIVLLAESGGAASAVYRYIEHGMVIDPGFEAFEATLEEIRQLHVASGNLLVTSFLAEDDDEVEDA